MEKTLSNYDYNYWDQGAKIKKRLCKDCEATIDEMIEVNKERIEMELRVHHIDSQPGDATHYSYFVYREGYDNFHFMPKDNSFTYPQRLNYWDVKDIIVLVPHEQPEGQDIDGRLIILAEEHRCNPYTLMECIRTIKEIMEKKNGSN